MLFLRQDIGEESATPFKLRGFSVNEVFGNRGHFPKKFMPVQLWPKKNRQPPVALSCEQQNRSASGLQEAMLFGLQFQMGCHHPLQRTVPREI